MPILAITFDATGTLLEIRGGVGRQYLTVARAFGAEADPEVLGKAFAEVWQTMARPVRDGRPSPDDDRGWWRTLVEQVTDRTGLSVGDFEAFFDALYRRFETTEAWDLFPEVIEVLETLSGKYRLAVISDFDGRLRSVLKALDLTRYFETVIISSEVGEDKPAPAIFQAACQALGLEPSAVLHVGDDPRRDGAGAREFGMQAFELDRPRNSLRDLAAFLG